MKLSDFNAILKTSKEEFFDKRRKVNDYEFKEGGNEMFIFTCM